MNNQPSGILPPDSPSTATLGTEGPFDRAHFTQIPNEILTYVVHGNLKDRDLLTYAFFLSRSGAMLALKKQDYAALSEEKVAAFLNCSVRALRRSVQRLVAEDIIERHDTRANTRTRILLTVRDSKVVRKSPAFPKRKKGDAE